MFRYEGSLKVNEAGQWVYTYNRENIRFKEEGLLADYPSEEDYERELKIKSPNKRKGKGGKKKKMDRKRLEQRQRVEGLQQARIDELRGNLELKSSKKLEARRKIQFQKAKKGLIKELKERGICIPNLGQQMKDIKALPDFFASYETQKLLFYLPGIWGQRLFEMIAEQKKGYEIAYKTHDRFIAYGKRIGGGDNTHIFDLFRKKHITTLEGMPICFSSNNRYFLTVNDGSFFYGISYSIYDTTNWNKVGFFNTKKKREHFSSKFEDSLIIFDDQKGIIKLLFDWQRDQSKLTLSFWTFKLGALNKKPTINKVVIPRSNRKHFLKLGVLFNTSFINYSHVEMMDVRPFVSTKYCIKFCDDVARIHWGWNPDTDILYDPILKIKYKRNDSTPENLTYFRMIEFVFMNEKILRIYPKSATSLKRDEQGAIQPYVSLDALEQSIDEVIKEKLKDLPKSECYREFPQDILEEITEFAGHNHDYLNAVLVEK